MQKKLYLCIVIRIIRKYAALLVLVFMGTFGMALALDEYGDCRRAVVHRHNGDDRQFRFGGYSESGAGNLGHHGCEHRYDVHDEDVTKALSSGWGSCLGMLIGTVIKIVCCIWMAAALIQAI